MNRIEQARRELSSALFKAKRSPGTHRSEDEVVAAIEKLIDEKIFAREDAL